MADMSLAEGSADGMIRKICDHMGEVMRKKLDRAVEASKHKNDSVEAGRKFVEAYVDYMHYVEYVHAAVAIQKPGHGAPEAEEGGGHSHMR